MRAAAIALAAAILASAGAATSAPRQSACDPAFDVSLSNRERRRFTAAANGGDLKAMHALAQCALRRGGPLYYWGTWGDVRESERWWRKAAALGDTEAMLLLGHMYAEPWDVLQDRAEAARWFEMAAKAGKLEGVQNLIDLYLGDWSDERDEAAANRWIARAVALGDTHAMLLFGLRYDAGWGVRADAAQAATWYEKVISDGKSDWNDRATALNNLGALYETGRGVPKDESKAAALYRKAARGFSHAGYNLAVLCEEGRGVPQDKTAALWLYRNAALIPSIPQAQAALARLGFQAPDEEQEAGALLAHGRELDAKKDKTACEP
ncbi:MAG TPA: tetratricopeptide repeat protein [Rhizomicrobium sp.]|jgi:hypothetical protein|nr:tetratricopeptide repeat protein [Rhizomicrobium sp.]